MQDSDVNGTPSPGKAVLRALREHDETNLEDILVDDKKVEVGFLALATLCRYLLRDLIVLAKLKEITANHVKDRAGAECDRVDSISFTIDACLDVVRKQRHEISELPGSGGEVNDIGVASILAALFCEYGFDNVVQKL